MCLNRSQLVRPTSKLRLTTLEITNQFQACVPLQIAIIKISASEIQSINILHLINQSLSFGSILLLSLCTYTTYKANSIRYISGTIIAKIQRLNMRVFKWITNYLYRRKGEENPKIVASHRKHWNQVTPANSSTKVQIVRLREGEDQTRDPKRR